MSEYQYYEFRAIDRPLTEAEMRAVRAYSTRARITPTSFVNEYHWGDFKGDPAKWVERWYDAFLYLANWGSRELMLRIPADSLELDTARRYCPGECASASSHGAHLILSFGSGEEGDADDDSWDEPGSGWLSSILPLRAEIAGGDHRALYLAWLLNVQNGCADEDEPEPPVPPGLGALSGALTSFREFLRIDPDLVQAAAERSQSLASAPSLDETRGWIASLQDAERVELLARVATGQERQVRAELLRRLNASRAATAGVDAAVPPRAAQELLDAAERIAEERRRIRAAAAAREKQRRERKAAEAREKHLDRLAPRENETWGEVDALIATKQPRPYDQAVSLLQDLRDLAARDGRAPGFAARLQQLREMHARKPSFLARLRKVFP